MIMKVRVLVLAFIVPAVISCATRAPAASEFTVPAIGTPMPGGHEEAVQPELPPGQSGALVANQTGFPIQVAVSHTIATLGIGQDFLFALPPGAYEFYIYEPGSTPRIHAETLADGKLRYLYITRIVPPGG
jgi:hypothetical protein